MPHICRCYYQFSNPKRVQKKLLDRIGWNLAWTTLTGIQITSSRGFLIFHPRADIWDPLGPSPGSPEGPKNFFRFFSFSLFQKLPGGLSNTKNHFFAADAKLLVCCREGKGYISVKNQRIPQLDEKRQHYHMLRYTQNRQKSWMLSGFYTIEISFYHLKQRKIKKFEKKFGAPPTH